MAKIFTLVIFVILLPFVTFSQKKVLNAIKTTDKITIDGKFNETIWESTPIAKDFVMYYPENGKPEQNNKRTEVKIIYDNDAVYIAATMFDDEPTKILKQITKRDVSGIYDNFGVFINGFNDSQQDFRFYVSASGVQLDCFSSTDGYEDYTWNAVWDSEARITDDGWVVEMKIPYAALRFSNKDKQTWGLNFFREIRRDRQSLTWNFIDNNINNENIQAGLLEGIENIKTPVRLFFNPFASFYLTANEQQKTQGELKAGLDVKYGINDAFTLDLILIPDFGQIKLDDIVLNLTPFEQQYNENRPFFTEGVDLFQKGDLVYTRRIGGQPSYYPPLAENETINDYPSSVPLINAVKVSGRTNDGLGIGFLNAITAQTSATVTNTDTNENTAVVLEPVSNYNVLVLDQRIRKNSSISFVNTNVTRDGLFRDANVSALVFDLNTKANTFALEGDYKYSFVNEYGNEENKKGYNTSLNFAKSSGKYRFGVGAQYVSQDYDSNDLGINFQTHYHVFHGNVSYRTLEPTTVFNNINGTVSFYSEFDNNTSKIQSNKLEAKINFTTVQNDGFSLYLKARPTEIYNFYEARSIDDSKYFIEPKSIAASFVFSSNYNRKFALDFIPTYKKFNQEKRDSYEVIISPRYRFSNHLSSSFDFDFIRQNNNLGWIDFDADDNTIFARRNIITYVNSVSGKYAFNNKMNINLALRYYWSYTKNFQFYTLQDDGRLADNDIYNEDNNVNFNTWNFDLSYSWWFAPGSEMVVLYRNNSLLSDYPFRTDFRGNIKNVTDFENLNHVFSISVRYHIDYNSFKRK